MADGARSDRPRPASVGHTAPAMLYLLRSPCWAPQERRPAERADDRRADPAGVLGRASAVNPTAPAQGSAAAVKLLPATLPCCLLLYLAACGDWVERERVAALFWPDDSGTQSLRKLRVNLHRMGDQLQAWGCKAALHSQRQRLWLALPTDLAALQQAVARPSAQALLQTAPMGWLQGFRIPGFDEFWAWADNVAAQLRRSWLAACEAAVMQALQGGQTASATALFVAWQQAEGRHMPALCGMDPQQLPIGAMAAWQQMRSQVIGAHTGTHFVGHAGALAQAPAPLGLPGRAREIAHLREHLRSHRSQALVVLGEPGAGKSTLLQAAHPEGLWLHGREGLQGVPFGPLMEWLQQLPMAELRRTVAAPASPLAAYRLDLARLLPELAPDEPLPPLDAHTAKSRLLEVLSRLFEHHARAATAQATAQASGPRAALAPLLIDDLQWCDSATLEWLAFVAHRGHQPWCASARPHELSAAGERFLDTLGTAGLLQQWALPALGPAELAEACRSRWPQRHWGADVLQRLHAVCAGNPFVLGELVADGTERLPADGEPIVLPRRVRELVLKRLRSLSPAARAVIDAAAVLVRPVPLEVLRAVADMAAGGAAPPAATGSAPKPPVTHSAPPLSATDIAPFSAATPTPTSADSAADIANQAFVRGFEQALAAGELRADASGVQCRHDLIRSAADSALSAARRPWLHRRAALALAARAGAEPLVIAVHWQAAHEPQTALAWMHQGAQQQKERGHFDQARSLWRRVADESVDVGQALRARLALAECALFDDLAEGRTALEAVLRDAGAVADAQQRVQIVGQALAGLIDNAVFAGDLPRAQALAQPLREHLPKLLLPEQVHGCEVLIELAMREPEIDQAWSLWRQMRTLAPQRPSVRSFEAQIHWFAGDVRAACVAFETLLAERPDYCRSLTIENDLAVMQHVLGQIERAETMARRSLASWRGVPHTEALSLLVLGAILTSAGRFGEAHEALDQALALGQQQASALFTSQALVRRAQAWLQMGQIAAAHADLDAAAPLLRDTTEPLRLSHFVLLRVQCQVAIQQVASEAAGSTLGHAAGLSYAQTAGPALNPAASQLSRQADGRLPDAALIQRLRDAAQRMRHPLVHARLAQIDALCAQAAGQRPAAQAGSQRSAALAACQRWATLVGEAGLLESVAECLLLRARLVRGAAPARAFRSQALALARAQGFADLARRAQADDNKVVAA